MGFFGKKAILNTNKCTVYSAVHQTRYNFTFLLYIHVVTYPQQVEARERKGKPGNAAKMAPKAKLMG